MDRQKVIIIGSSGHSKVVIDIFEKEGKYLIVGLIDSYREIGDETLGYKVLGKEKDLTALLLENPDYKVFIAIGDNWIRKKVYDGIVEHVPNVDFASAIHPSAQIGKAVQIGKGIAVMPGVIVNSATKIGNFTILNTKASIDHDCLLSDFSSLAPNATIGGRVSIGEFSAISIGAVVNNGISIGAHSIIGAGAVLMKSCGDNLLLYGIPAKVIRSREIGESYLITKEG